MALLVSLRSLQRSGSAIEESRTMPLIFTNNKYFSPARDWNVGGKMHDPERIIKNLLISSTQRQIVCVRPAILVSLNISRMYF